jgi:hypothetical protein
VVRDRSGGFVHDDRHEFAGLRVEDIDQKLVEIKHRILLGHHIMQPDPVNTYLVRARHRRDDRREYWFAEMRASGDRLYSFDRLPVFCPP